MNRWTLAIVWLAACAASPPLTAAEPQKSIDIPLEKIWGANMPGTRDIRDLEPRTPGDRRKFGPLMSAIYRELMHPNEEQDGPDACHALVVPGKDIEALNEAYDIVFGNHWEGPNVVPSGEISLVFYARGSGQYVYVEKVQRESMVITIQYRFVTHRERHRTAHFALIPLGKLIPGAYEVRIDQLPVRFPDDEQRPVFRPPFEGERVTRTVSQPFSFEVK